MKCENEDEFGAEHPDQVIDIFAPAEGTVPSAKAKPSQASEKELQDKQGKQVIVYVPNIVTNEFIAEENYKPPLAPRFAVFYFEDERIEIKDQIVRPREGGREIINRPIDNKDVVTGQVLLPSEPLDYSTDLDLFDEIRYFLDRWHQERDMKSRYLDVCYIFITYIRDLLPVIPYRRKMGRTGTGKSTWAEVMAYVCYRSVFLAGVDSEASLRRTFELWRGTSIIDEGDFKYSDLYSSVIKILNIGYSSSIGWYRCQDTEDPGKTVSFYVYGPKIITTRELFQDTALESRCLTSRASSSDADIPMFRMDEFRAEALILRNKLLMWRFKNYRRIKERLKVLEKKTLRRELFGNVKVENRTAELIIPLLLIFDDEGVKELLKRVAQEASDFLRSVDSDITWEYILPEILKDIVENPVGREGYEERTVVKEVDNHYRIPLTYISKRVLTWGKGEQVIDDKELKSTSRSLAKYFRKNLMMVRRESGNRTYVYIPKSYIIDNRSY